jgi:hypothetical protein
MLQTQSRGVTPGTAVAAIGTERIACETCRYNQWGSVGLLFPQRANQKGKATTNQRSVFILLEGREAPVEMILPPTSLSAFDQYLTTLTTQAIPVQAVLTAFRQEVKSRGATRWGVAKFENTGLLDGDTFTLAMAKREQFKSLITPATTAASFDAQGAAAAGVDEGLYDADGADDAPF